MSSNENGLVSFLDRKRLSEAAAEIDVSPKGMRMPDETAFQLVLRAQALLAKAHPLAEAERAERAAAVEFITGYDADAVRNIVDNMTPDPAGSARCHRILAQTMTGLLDFEPRSYGYGAIQGDAELTRTGRPGAIAREAWKELREEGLTPLGSAITLAGTAMIEARREGVSPWQRLRVLVEELEETLLELDVTARDKNAG